MSYRAKTRRLRVSKAIADEVMDQLKRRGITLEEWMSAAIRSHDRQHRDAVFRAECKRIEAERGPIDPNFDINDDDWGRASKRWIEHQRIMGARPW